MDKTLGGKDYLVGACSIADTALFTRVLGSKRMGMKLPAKCEAHLNRMLARLPTGDAAGRPGLMDGRVSATLARIPFWFLRHGETDWNAAEFFAGQRRYLR